MADEARPHFCVDPPRSASGRTAEGCAMGRVRTLVGTDDRPRYPARSFSRRYVGGVNWLGASEARGLLFTLRRTPTSAPLANRSSQSVGKRERRLAVRCGRSQREPGGIGLPTTGKHKGAAESICSDLVPTAGYWSVFQEADQG